MFDRFERFFSSGVSSTLDPDGVFPTTMFLVSSGVFFFWGNYDFVIPLTIDVDPDDDSDSDSQ